MPYSTKRMIGRIAQSAVFYRLVPPGRARVFSGLRYHYARQNWSNVTQLAKADLQHTTEHLSSGMLAARAGFYATEDDWADAIIDRLLDRFPAEPQIFELRADLRRFQGRYGDAMADAERARFLVPSSLRAVSGVMELSYLAHPSDVADRICLDDLRRYPRSTKLYWAAAYGCRDAKQFDRIMQIWRATNEPESITSFVHPLATAAGHAGEIEAACQLYRDAIRVAADAGAPEADDPRSNFIAAPDVAAAIHNVMSGAGIPYFFAGATARALARHGRVGHEGTVDVGVFESDWDRSALEKVFSADPRFTLTDRRPKNPNIEVVHRSNVTVNIVRFYCEDGRLWHDSIAGRAWNTPFDIEIQRFGLHAFPVPSDLATHLQGSYGDLGRPTSSSPVDAPNGEVTWPEYARLNRLRRAFEQVCSGDLSEATNELVSAEEGELASVIEARLG